MKIAVYCNNANTLGHSTRLLALLKSIKRRIPASQIVLLEGSRAPMDLSLRDYARVMALPHALDWNGQLMHRQDYRRRLASAEQMFQERFDRSRAVLRKFRPDLFMVEHFPFMQGPWAREIPLLLEFVKQNMRSKIVSSAGYLNYAPGVYQNIAQYLDYLFVHSPERLALTYLDWLDKNSAAELDRAVCAFRDRIYFTGFVFDRPNPAGSARLRSQRQRRGYKQSIFVSRGGGAWNDGILSTTLLAARIRPDWFFTICCGPATSRKTLAMCQKMLRGLENVQLFDFLRPVEFDRHMLAADLCVSLGGYNTALKLLYYRRRAVLVPHDISEQLWRAQWLSEYIPAVILPERTATARRLCVAMDAALRKAVPRKKIPSEWFAGASQTVRMLSCLA